MIGRLVYNRRDSPFACPNDSSMPQKNHKTDRPNARQPNERPMARRAAGPWGMVLATAALAYLVGAVFFFPILGFRSFEFVDFDVHYQIVANPYIRGLTLENIWHILTSRCITSYYPARTLSYAMDYQIWGLNPVGFEVTNALLHLVNVLLVFWLILRLFTLSPPHPLSPSPQPSPRAGGGWWEIAVATFGAGIFAIHPIVVEPVVWVCGREELLMTLGALGSIHFHLAARQIEAAGRGRGLAIVLHAAAAVACAAACLSNAVAAAIPFLAVAFDLLIPPRPSGKRILAGTAALWAICAATLVLKHFDLDKGQSLELEYPMFSVQRLLLVAKVFWLNTAALVWPTDLACSYGPIAPGGPSDPAVLLGGMAIGLGVAVLWLLRRWKTVAFGLVWFILALGPSAQVLPHHINRADRFLYLPLVGLAVAAAMVLLPLGRRLQQRWEIAAVVSAGVLLLWAMDRRCAGQVALWQDSLLLWENCVRIAPRNPLAHSAYADALKAQRRFDEAGLHYREGLKLKPDMALALNNYASMLANCERPDLRDYPRAIELAEGACELTKWQDNDCRRTLAIACTNYGTDLFARKQFSRAEAAYRKAVEIDPEYRLGLLDLALLRATCQDQSLLDPAEAVQLAERASRLTKYPPDANSLSVLAAAYASAGRFQEAVVAAKRAIELAQAGGQKEMLPELDRRLRVYQSGSAYRDP